MLFIKLFGFVMWTLLVWSCSACTWYTNGRRDGVELRDKYRTAFRKFGTTINHECLKCLETLQKSNLQPICSECRVKKISKVFEEARRDV